MALPSSPFFYVRNGPDRIGQFFEREVFFIHPSATHAGAAAEAENLNKETVQRLFGIYAVTPHRQVHILWEKLHGFNEPC